MSYIAEQARGSRDAALDYKEDEVHMLDPFLLFFLRYGTWDATSGYVNLSWPHCDGGSWPQQGTVELPRFRR